MSDGQNQFGEKCVAHLDDAAPEAVDHGVEAGGGQREGLSKYRGDEDATEAQDSAGLHQPGNGRK